MSQKPPKKSDAAKRWMHPRRDQRRIVQPEYHLIVTESSKTEPLYFKALKTQINQQYPGRIQLNIFGTGRNTLSLLERAKTLAASGPIVYKHVWVVYDTDSFPAERIDQTAEQCAVISSETTQYHAVWSNQCIELWFLLHFSFLHADLYRDQYIPKLNAALAQIGAGHYEKNRADLFTILYPFIDIAIEHAKKLELLNSAKPPSQSAPGTKVYTLIEKLRPYL